VTATRLEGSVLKLEGALTLHTVPAVLEQCAKHAAGSYDRVDFSAVTELDSSAVALALELKRSAKSDQVSFEAVPEALRNLAQLYGVSSLLGIEN
jgi:phospholipid transport system transporter-binding protein